MSHSVGDTVTLDGIESVIIYDNGSEAEWGRYLCVDKNHDLVWYITGSDYQNESESGSVINSTNKYGYEWGGYQTVTGITYRAVGDGLSNTNSLIGMNLQPETSGWFVIWDKVAEARTEIGSDKWFVPSENELNLIYENKDSLSGLATIARSQPYYWSSSEFSSTGALDQDFFDGRQYGGYKNSHFVRVRLCRYTTDSELDKKVWTNDEIITSTELNRIETRIKELHSSYTPTVWNKDEVITKDRLNKIETQIGNDKVWEDGNIITADDLNDIENYLI